MRFVFGIVKLLTYLQKPLNEWILGFSQKFVAFRCRRLRRGYKSFFGCRISVREFCWYVSILLLHCHRKFKKCSINFNFSTQNALAQQVCTSRLGTNMSHCTSLYVKTFCQRECELFFESLDILMPQICCPNLLQGNMKFFIALLCDTKVKK